MSYRYSWLNLWLKKAYRPGFIFDLEFGARIIQKAESLRRTLLALFIMLCLSAQAVAQVTTEGTEFWFGFMQNNDGGNRESSLEVFFTSKERAQVQMTTFEDGQTVDVTVNPGQTVKRVINAASNNPFAASGSGNIQNKGIRVTSDVPISIYAFNNRQLSGDAAVILPVNTLGKQYYASTYYEEHQNGDSFSSGPSQSQFLIVATADNTVINFTPTVDLLQGTPAGTPFSISLDAGEVFQVQAEGDLTGTLIEAVSQNEDDCKNFAVFGGNLWTRVTGDDNCATSQGAANYPGGFAADHLYEQLYPVNTWGRQYTAVPFELRTGYVLRITAAEDGTLINVGGELFDLDAGEFTTVFREGITSISSDKPLQVAQFSQSLSCDFNVTTGPGDPFMLMLSPNEQQLKEITFNALATDQITDYFVTLITPSSAIDELTVNGTAVSDFDTFSPVPLSDFSYSVLDLDKGVDVTVESETGFIAYVYGFGNIESFGYVAGASLENLNLELVGDDETIGVIVQEGCVDSQVTFDVEFEEVPGQPPRYTVFEWDFGDGNTEVGKSVAHTYTEAGQYEISLVASDGGGACGNSETVTRSITITETTVEQTSGPQSVCPDVTEIEYSVTGPTDNTYQWFVEGGTISSQSNDQITVDWGAARDDAFVKIVPSNYLGCLGDTITLDVRINKRLEPALPQGPAEVCLADIASVVYTTPATNGSSYFWFIEGGSFLTDRGSNQITVAWDGVGAGRVWYREFNEDISECEGFSDPLEVVVYDDVMVTGDITNVSCSAGTDGALSLTISGGKPGDYGVSWDNGMSGATISGLAAGSYTAMVTDEINCQASITLTVTEPPELMISNATVQDVRCFQEANGAIFLEMSGGTPFDNDGYRYTWSGPNTTLTTTTPELTGRVAGDYSVVVEDANGCQTGMDFTIAEPALLEPDLESLINQPICPDATNGTAFVEAKGGTPDYQFYWSNNATVDEQQGMNFSQGSYTLRIVDVNGCETSLGIEVTERFPRIYVPNAFSPNGDGENEEFKAVTDCDLGFSMQVFNEWGAVIFATEDIFRGWDGTLDGKPAPIGKYSYIIFYSGSINGTSFEETLRGTLRLVR